MKNVIIAKGLLSSVEQSGTLFGRGGIRLRTAATSEEILDLHRQAKADLIITEFSLPVMSGDRLCAAIRAEERLRDVSIVVACPDSAVFRAACRDAGVNAVIGFPVDPFELFSKIAELIVIPQRKDMRVLLRVSVDGQESNVPFFASSYNISISGMLLETKHELREGDHLLCSFNIAHAGIDTACTVMRVERTAAGRFRCGVKFQNLAARSIVVIEQYVKSRIKQ